MRVIRGATACAVALAVVLTVQPAAASAAGPTAPYTAFTVNGGADNHVLAAGTRVFDEGNATFTVDAWGRGFTFDVVAPSGYWHAFVVPPVGSDFVAGTRYQTGSSADDTHAMFKLGGEHRGCGQAGWLEVEEFTKDPETGAPATFAASYETTCENRTVPMSGELRWRSAVGYTAVAMDTDRIDFGIQYLGDPGPDRTVTLTSAGPLPVTLGSTETSSVSGAGFEIVTDDCAGATLIHGQSCVVSVRMLPVTTTDLRTRLIFPDGDGQPQREVLLVGAGRVSAKGTFRPVDPARLLDTRSGLGAAKGPVTDRQVINLQVAGRGGVPATAVSAVVLNVTVTGPSRGGHLTAYPAGTTQPTASNVNFNPGQTIANSVTVQVGADGRVAILHRGGSTHVIADVTGYHFGTDAVPTGHQIGGEYYSVTPQRILDTRDPSFGGQLLGGWSVTLPVDYGPEANPHIRALAVNVTAVSPQTGGYLTTWNGWYEPPTASTLNFAPGRITPNMAIVPVAPCPAEYPCAGLPSIGIFNGSGRGTHILVDIFGIFDDGGIGNGLRFRPMSPTRITDTRTGLGVPGPLGPDSTATITPPAPVINSTTRALAINATAVAPTASTYLTVWPAAMDLDQPVVSTLNPAAGDTVPNATIARVGPGYGFHVYNRSGSTNLVVDVAGAFDYLPHMNPSERSVDGARRGLPGPSVLVPVSTPTPVAAQR